MRAPIRPRVGLALGLVLLCGIAGIRAASAVERGAPAPSFSAPALAGGGNVSLSAYHDKVVYLDFWASWCPPCLESLPQFEQLRAEFPANRFQIVAVNLDKDPAKARAFLAKHPVGYPSGSDPDGKIPGSFGLKTMPTSYLIDERGVVRYVHEGFRKGDLEEIRSQIRELVGSGK
jgi:thiol-disulfide isomerase/thioredoxin